MLFSLDDWLIEQVFEPVAHRIQLQTGVVCFVIARTTLYIAAITWIMWIYLGHWPIAGSFDVFVLVVGLLVGVWYQSLLRRSVSLERQFASTRIQSKNPERLGLIEIFFRFLTSALVFLYCLPVLLLLIFVLGAEWQEDVGLELEEVVFLLFKTINLSSTWLSLYLLACTPIPPEAEYVRRGVYAAEVS